MLRVACRCAALWIFLTASAGAQTEMAPPPSPMERETFVRFLAVMDVYVSADEILNGMVATVQKAVEDYRAQGKSLPPDIMTRVERTIEREMESGSFESALWRYYRTQFSVDDMKAIADFYASRPGRRLKAVSNEVTRQTFDITLQWVTDLNPRVLATVEAAIAEPNTIR